MYQVWTKDEFGDTWHLTECEDEEDVKGSILVATKAGNEVKVSLPMEFSIDVTIKEGKAGHRELKVKEPTARQIKEKEVAENEVTESGPEEDPVAGDQGNSPV
ncbi:MAG: hypothetical protein KAT75_00710 [Dehalococcoidia bacterium]|nr:hypothetical protein [Dehalococcoidia bacterium]